MNIKITLYLLATLPVPFSVHAEPSNILDEKGQLILQVNANDSKVASVYDKNGRLVKKEMGLEKRFHYDSKGDLLKNNGGQKP